MQRDRNVEDAGEIFDTKLISLFMFFFTFSHNNDL